MSAEIDQLRVKFGQFDINRIADLVVRGSEIRESVGNPDISEKTGYLLDYLRVEIREAVERSTPKGVSYTSALRYVSEQTLPIDLVFFVYDELPSPLKLIVNVQQHKKIIVSLMPGEAIIRFRGIARRDLNRIGRFITEAIAILEPEGQSHGRSGRKTIDESPDDMATAALVARLFHWENWSQRRIAAFLGWMKPTDDWQDPKTRARIEQRVRRWLRLGESALATSFKDIDAPESEDDDQPWKRRPASIEAAIRAENRTTGRR